MIKNFASKLLNLFPTALLLSALSVQGATDLRNRAANELRIPEPKSNTRNSRKKSAANPAAVTPTTAPATVAAPAPTPYLQSVLPPDERSLSRPKWTFELGLENQRPRGQINVLDLSPLNLDNFDTKLAYSATLGWWFGDALQPVWGPRWRSALTAQVAWSQHQYALQIGQSPTPTSARLQVIRPQLGLVAEYLAYVPTEWNLEFWVGAEAAAGRLMQSQTSKQSDIVNTSTNKNYWEWGTQVRTVLNENYLVSLQYRQRLYTQEGSSHHGILALGLAL